MPCSQRHSWESWTKASRPIPTCTLLPVIVHATATVPLLGCRTVRIKLPSSLLCPPPPSCFPLMVHPCWHLHCRKRSRCAHAERMHDPRSTHGCSLDQPAATTITPQTKPSCRMTRDDVDCSLALVVPHLRCRTRRENTDGRTSRNLSRIK